MPSAALRIGKARGFWRTGVIQATKKGVIIGQLRDGDGFL
jgi:hypothetical protein